MRLRILFLGTALFLSGCAASSDQESDFQIKKAIYSVHQEVVDMLKTTPTKQPVCEGSIVKGCQPVLYFDLNSVTLTDETMQSLDWTVSKMLHYDRYNISLTGHSDQTGDTKDNLKLSEKRANAIRDYLVDKGIDEQRIEVAFKGDSEPVCSEEEMCNELNRRVEAKIYSVNTDLSDFADFMTTNIFHNQKNEE